MIRGAYYLLVLCFFVPNNVLASTIQLPKTGLAACYDAAAKPIACKGTGQDGELQKGVAWPKPRFTTPDGSIQVSGAVVVDQLTGLMWTRNANLPASNLTWQQALDYVNSMNAGAGTFGYTDWRLPNMSELLSLGDISQTAPALPPGHPFSNIVPFTLYWSSSTNAARPDHAWGMVVSFAGGAFDAKINRHPLWPVRSASPDPDKHNAAIHLPKTGQNVCYSIAGEQISCTGTGQDGDLQKGVEWPMPRFTNPDGSFPVRFGVVADRLTGLMWTRNAALSKPISWQKALEYVNAMNAGEGTFGYKDWRLPNINELASLLDIANSNPPLPTGHPFNNVQPLWYWSSSENCMHKEIEWGVTMFFGRHGHDAKNSLNPLWPVRGGQEL